MKDIVLFGMPGAGKGTQASLLLEKMPHTFRHLSTGDIFRAVMSKPNAIGDYVHDRLNAGLLIDDQVTISIFNAYFRSVIDENKKMMLDGYPRTISQLDALFSISEQNDRQLMGLFFELPEDEAKKRILSRGRNGENENTISVRMQEYYKKTAPIVEAFGKKAPLISIDARSDIAPIHQEVMQHIG